MIDRHAIAQNTRDKFGIVPIFGVKLLAQALNRGFISTLVLKLEVVTATTIGAYILDDFTLRNRLGQGNALVIVLQTGENFVRIAVEQAHESHPFFLIVLEANNVAGQLFGSNLGHFGLFAGYNGLFFFLLLFLLVFLRHRNHHARTASVAIDRTALAARTPSFYIQAVNQRLVYIVGQVHRYADRVVYPLLYRALHLHLHQPVYVVCRGLIIRRLFHNGVYFFLRISLFSVKPVGFHPVHKLLMVHDVLFETVAHLVNEVHMHVCIVGIYLSTAFVHRHKHRFDAACCLRHQASCSRGSDS